LFAQSVEEASLPAAIWPSRERGVAYYGPTLELLKPPAPSAEPAPALAEIEERQDNRARPAVRQIPLDTPQHDNRQHDVAAQTAQPQPPAAVPREVVRDVPEQRAAQPVKRKHARKPRSAPRDEVADVNEPDPREARAQHRPRPLPRSEEASGRDRRYRDRTEHPERADRRVTDRRRPESEPRESRVVVREVIQEPEPRTVRSPGFPFNPLRMFGIFERH
jgi:hypothetical protein